MVTVLAIGEKVAGSVKLVGLFGEDDQAVLGELAEAGYRTSP
jgi:hypothetical protein